MVLRWRSEGLQPVDCTARRRTRTRWGAESCRSSIACPTSAHFIAPLALWGSGPVLLHARRVVWGMHIPTLASGSRGQCSGGELSGLTPHCCSNAGLRCVLSGAIAALSGVRAALEFSFLMAFQQYPAWLTGRTLAGSWMRPRRCRLCPRAAYAGLARAAVAPSFHAIDSLCIEFACGSTLRDAAILQCVLNGGVGISLSVDPAAADIASYTATIRACSQRLAVEKVLAPAIRRRLDALLRHNL
mmetsp:Transcript_13312/g.42081  ORF Transcript_13312/g.42081 Transcript_13312/m.42081 type:complete len:244 (+) Transcript_13312:120-851(+)